MKVVVFLAVLVACIFAQSDLSFEEYVHKYAKTYSIQDLPFRRAIFEANKARIAELNAEARRNGYDTVFAINSFSDLSPMEFKQMFKGYEPVAATLAETQKEIKVNDPLPTSWDWRQKNVVSAVKDQGRCGSCWAFSATEGVESAWAMKHQQVVVLAPQQIVSCDRQDGGCNGGDLPTAFAYVKSNGQEKETDYPYTSGHTGRTGTCTFNAQDVAVRITGFQYATRKTNETEMQASSLVNGPLSVCVDAETWQSYHSGIIQSNCGTRLDHCVQVVGWDTNAQSKVPYWIVRNSWGTSWGISGYIYIARNKNLCGIAKEATYVTV